MNTSKLKPTAAGLTNGVVAAGAGVGSIMALNALKNNVGKVKQFLSTQTGQISLAAFALYLYSITSAKNTKAAKAGQAAGVAMMVLSLRELMNQAGSALPETATGANGTLGNVMPVLRSMMVDDAPNYSQRTLRSVLGNVQLPPAYAGTPQVRLGNVPTKQVSFK